MKKLKIKHKPCFCDDCLAAWYKPKCVGCGHHNSFWATVIESPQWMKWKMHNDKIGQQWDFMENEELGVISPEHFQEFIKFIKK